MRELPVADGVLKHQLYIAQQVGGSTTRGRNEAVLTFWTWKAGGSPVSGTRIAAEQGAILAWVTSDLRNQLNSGCLITDLRTWDYGLDPAPRTATMIFPFIGGNSGLSYSDIVDTFIVPLRSQPTTSGVRNRLNGRLGHPGLSTATGDLAPSAGSVTTCYSNLRTGRLNGAGDVGTWCIVSYFSGGAARVVPLVVLIDHVGTIQRRGSQRRRRAKPGPYPRGF